MRHLNLLTSVLLASTLTACGGGGSGTEPPSDDDPALPMLLQTTLTAPSVAGMRVVACGNGVACIDEVRADNSLTMVRNGTLDLYVGPLKVLSAQDTSKAVDSAFDFSPTADEASQSFVNAMTLLYSLDADLNPDNGIALASGAGAVVTSAMASAIRFDLSAEDFVAQPMVQAVVDSVAQAEGSSGVTLTVRDPSEVKATLKKERFTATWGGNWALTLDDAAGSKVMLAVAPSGTVSVNDGPVEFTLTTDGKEAAVRFFSRELGSFNGKLYADGTGRGTWALTDNAGWWTASKAVATDE